MRKNVQRIMSFLLVCMLLFSCGIPMQAAAEDKNGTCGLALTWTFLEESGLLTEIGRASCRERV